MKNKITFIITTLLIFISCRPYLDCGKNIDNDYMNFKYGDSHNEFIYKSKIDAITDTEIYQTTHFSINLPKKIKNWKILGNKFYFEYPNKEMIYIYSGYKNKVSPEKWSERETNNSEVYNSLNSYWYEKKYNENLLATDNPKRVSKVYSDGKTLILLFNIKKDNLSSYLELVKSHKYLN